MSMIPLASCQGTYYVTPQKKQAIRFRWEVPTGRGVTQICIVPADEQGGAKIPRRGETRTVPFSSAPDGYEYSLPAFFADKISVRSFYVYAFDQPGKEEEAAWKELVPIEVLVGRAEIVWSMTETRAGDWTSYGVTLQSDTDLMEGMLGYRFLYCDLPFEVRIPGKIVKGRNEYPAISLPSWAAAPEVCVLNKNTGSSVTVARATDQARAGEGPLAWLKRKLK